MKTLKFLGAAVLPLLMTAGCGGGGSSAPPTTADFCTQYAAAVCQIAANCGVPMATCTTHQESVCQAMAASATAGGLRVFTPGNVNDCIGKVKAAYGSTNPITPSTMASIDLACQYVFQGKGVQLTSSCTTQFDCAGSTNGSVICDANSHLCATSASAALGAQCGNAGQVCAQDSYCAPNPSNVLLCMAEAKSGDACTTVPCSHSYRCAAGVCTDLVQAAGACTSNSDCASGAPYCNPYTNPPSCGTGLQFAAQSPSCLCVAEGTSCPTGNPTGQGGQGGQGQGGQGGQGQGGKAGQAGGAGGTASGAAGAGGSAGGGAAGAAGSAGAAGGAGGQAGTAGSAGAGGAA
jgi:hypothetical protein